MTDSEPTPDHYDVIVIGCGAAGLMAAARSAERGRRTLLVERNRKAGVKILMSGGTRCNLTHDCEIDGIVEAFGSAGKFLHSPLASLGPRELVRWFHAEGLPTTVEAGTGKIFPASNKALDVVRVLVARLERTGAEMALGEKVLDVNRHDEGFVIKTAVRQLTCDKLIITTGGKSYPGCGTTGDGWRWLAAMGHTIREPRPALVPITTDDAWVHELSGITLPDVGLRVIDRNSLHGQKPKRKVRGLPHGVLIDRRGSLLFTHHGLTGPVALDVSREVTKCADPSEVVIHGDWLPDRPARAVEDWLADRLKQDGRKQVIGLIPELIPRRLAESIFLVFAIPLDRRCAELSKVERANIVKGLKAMPIHPTGSRGFEKAEVTAGGVALNEVDSRTMQSKIVPNLYLAGEVLDIDGFLGGYNFQGAFSTGWVAGGSV